jgi:hypothetical protein
MKRYTLVLAAVVVLGSVALTLTWENRVPAPARPATGRTCFQSVMPGWSVIELSGRPLSAGAYEVQLNLVRGNGAEALKGLVVVAEPSGTVLAAHWNGPSDAALRALPEVRGALATVELETAMNARPRYRIPWVPKGSTGFTIKAAYGDRVLPVMVNARVSTEGFTVGIEFDAGPFFERMAAVQSGLVVPMDQRPYRVCCGCSSPGGDRCRECIQCTEDPPTPQCACPGCAVSCS